MSCFFTLLYCHLDLTCGECDVISLYFMCCSVNGCVALLMDVFVLCVACLTEFVNCLVKQRFLILLLQGDINILYKYH